MVWKFCEIWKILLFWELASRWAGERGGSVVECRTPEREVRGSRPTVAVLCPWARHFTPRKYWLITQEAMAPSRHDWKIVDWDVKPQHNQKKNPDGPNSVRFYLSVRYGMYEVWLCHRKMPPKGVNRMTNSVDPDQTALVLNFLPRLVCLKNLIHYAKH